MHSIVFLFVVFLALAGVELLLLGACQGAAPANRAKVIRAVCRILLGTLILGYLLLIGLFLWVGADMLLHGPVRQGVSVLASGAVLGVCVYFWLVRGWVRHLKQMKEKP